MSESAMTKLLNATLTKNSMKFGAILHCTSLLKFEVMETKQSINRLKFEADVSKDLSFMNFRFSVISISNGV